MLFNWIYFLKSHENKAIRDCHVMIVVVEGWLRHVHSSTLKQSLEACVEPFPAEMYVTECIFIRFFVT